MRSPIIDRVLREAVALQGAAVADHVASRITALTVLESVDGVDDPELLKYYAWTPKGIEAFNATRVRDFVLFGGAKGGSKTVSGCRIIAHDVARYKGGRYLVFRQNYTTLHLTTVSTFERFFPPELVIRKTEKRWYLVNDNEIDFVAADRTKDRNYEKIRGLESTAIMVDEAPEFDDEFYGLLPSLIRRDAFHVETSEVHPGWIYLTANPVPGTNYVKRHFIDERTRVSDGTHVFIPSLPDDNPLLPKGYIDRAFSRMTPETLAMLRHGDWNVETSEFVVVPPAHLAPLLIDRVSDRTPVCAGIDIGLGRPDKTVVWCANAAGEMWKEDTFELYDTMAQADRLGPVVERVKSAGGKVYIDEGSVGKGLVDRLRRMFGSSTIVGVMFGAAAEEERQPSGRMERVHDLKRDQLYFWFREDVIAASEAYVNGGGAGLRIERDEALVEELENTLYVPKDRYMKVEPKDEIKRKIGRSPDDADGAVLCNAARRRRRGGMTLATTSKTTATTTRRTSITDGY